MNVSQRISRLLVHFPFLVTFNLRRLPETQLFKSSGLVLLGFLNGIFQSGRFLEVTLSQLAPTDNSRWLFTFRAEPCKLDAISTNFHAMHEDDRISIAGKELTMDRLLGRGFAALITAGVGLWLCSNGEATEEGFSFLVFGFIAFLIALMLPFNCYEYVDLQKGNIVKVRHYVGIPIDSRSRPLGEFSRIVVRHLCHDAGEGVETFTGSVGLKGEEKEHVLWVKHFPATSEEFPAEASRFSEDLAKRTGLPVKELGNIHRDTEVPEFSKKN